MGCGCAERREQIKKVATQVKETVITQVKKVFNPPQGRPPKTREEMIAERVRKAKIERQSNK